MSEELRMGETTTAPKLNLKTSVPSPLKSRFERAGGWLICVGAAIACGVALFNFSTWWWWQDWRIGAASNTVPMAPNTALILMTLGGVLLLHQRWKEQAAVHLIGFVAAGIATVPAVIAGLQYMTGVDLAWDHLLMSSDDTVRGIPVGHMSPLSAGAFLLAAISLAALLPPLAGRRLFYRAGLVTAALGAVGSIIIALAYASGTPLFYTGGIIPMAFLTAIDLAALNLALLTAAVLGVRRRAESADAPLFLFAPSWRDKERNPFIVFGVLALGIALAGFFFLRSQQAAMRDRIADQLTTIADLKVSQIVNWQNERLGDARLLMQTPSLARSAAAFFANPDSAAASTEIFAYISALRNIYRYEAVVLFDQRMNPRLAVPPPAVTTGPRLQALLEAVPGASDVLVSDLHLGANGDIHMDLIAPIRDLVVRPSAPNPEPTQSVAPLVGAMLLRINPRDFLYPVIQKWPVPSETGETLLMRREGDEVVFLNDLRHQPGAALTLRRSVKDEQMPAALGTRDLFGATEGVDYRGVAVLAAVRAVPGSPWILVAKVDQSEIYSPLRRQAWAVSATVIALLLAAAFAAVLLRRQTMANFLQRELVAETERRALAERLALVTRHANESIFLMDDTRRIVEANDRALAAYGYTLDELRQLPPGSLRAPGTMDNRSQQLALFDSAVGAMFETVHQRKDGTIFPVEVSGRSVEIAGRQGSMAIIRDITARKRGEAALRESEQKYRELVEHAGSIILRWARDGKITFLNEFGQKFFGYSEAEILGRHVVGTIVPANESNSRDLRGMMEQIGAHPEAFEQNINENMRRNGERVWVAWDNKLVLDEQGQVKEILSVGSDITARKQAEEALKQSEERYRLLFENNPLPMWLYDLESLRFLAVNESAVQHYGYTREEFLAMTIEGIRPEEDIPALLKSADEGRAERLGTSEWRHRRKDGAIIQVEIRSRPLVFNGREARLVLATDITEKKLLEEKFLHVQRLESIGMLASGIAHDLNNVLAPIVFAAPLLRASLSAPRDLKILATLEQSAGRGAGLVKQILGFAHNATGEFQSTQVKHLLRDIIGVIEATFPKSIQLEHQIPSNLWPVQGNATQIHQVLMNLCVNARDAMPSGGTLRIVAANRRLDAAAASAISGGQPGAWLVLEVTDTGTGIAPEMLARIWTPFFTTKGIDKGTGLGLATVRGIVASHHGFVELDTKVGRGSTFRVFLPAVVNESPRPSSVSPFATPDGHGELILVADDDKAIRDMVTEILGNHGYRVLSCADGMEAISLIYARPGDFSLVVTDADMPRLDGVALMRAVLQMRPDIRFLAMSGLSPNETGAPDLPEIQKLAHAFLTKPFKPEDLLGAIHRLLHPSQKT